MSKVLNAKCACGAVKAKASGPFRDATACHCESCRRQSGHYIAATRVDASSLKFENKTHLKWWYATDEAKRGFCSECGSLMFWQADGSDQISIFMGCLDAPTGIQLTKHIYLEEKGDYYEV
ncbi:MAG: GFA family protein [Hyphomicrobiales bacterium]